MDEHGQIGPEKGDYDHDVDEIGLWLQAGKPVTFPLTHRMTRQQVTIVLKRRITIYGGGPEGTRGPDEWTFVAVDEKGSYWFPINMTVHPTFLVDKLGLNIVDAETLSDFLARLGRALGHDVRPTQSVVTPL